MEKIKSLLDHIRALESELQTINDEIENEKGSFFNTIVENSPGFISIVQENKFVFINSAGLQLLGLEKTAPVIGYEIFDFFHSENRVELEKQLQSALNKEKRKPVIVKMLHKKLSWFDVELSSTSFNYNREPSILLICRDVTHEYESIRISQQEEKLRTDILNSFDELIAFYEPDHKIKWLNNSAKKQLGIEDNSYIGKQCYKVWYNSSDPCKSCPVVDVSYESSERITTRGDKRSWLVRHTPLVDSAGKISGYIEFSSDITVKLELESELKKSRERLQKAEVVASLAHFEHDIEKNLKLWSPGAYPILGLPHNEDYLKNVDFLSNLHSDDAERASSLLEKAYREELGFDLVYRIIDSNGIEKTLHGIGEVQKGKHGSRKFFGTMQDITHILKLKKKLAEEEDKYKKLADFSPMGICIGDDCSINYMNDTLLHTLGYNSVEELSRSGIENILFPEDMHIVTHILKHFKEGTINFPEKKVVRIVRKDESIRHLEIFVTDCTIDNKLYLQAITQDITAEMEIEHIRKKLAADALYINQKNKITLEIRNELDKIISTQKGIPKNTFQKIYDIIGSYERLDDDWQILKTHFEQIHPNFFTRLNQEYPCLSVNDIKHCACIKLNFDTKETARFFNVKPDSIQMSRVRLKKKLVLSETTDLRSFILNF